MLTFSKLCCFLFTFCCKFSKFIQILITSHLVESLNKIPSHQPLQIESEFDAYKPIFCPNLNPEMRIQSKCNLLPPFMDSIVISNIFPHLPMTPFHSLAHVTNKQGMVYGCCKKCHLKCILDTVRVDHRPYVLSIAKIGNPRVCLQKCFEHELECLN